MRIQKITVNNFTADNKQNRRTNVDRAATVQDLYEMEDRINLKNAEMLRQQNEQIANLMFSQVKYYINPCPEKYSILKANIENLKACPVETV